MSKIDRIVELHVVDISVNILLQKKKSLLIINTWILLKTMGKISLS